jgi:hypothetical protein
MSLTEEQQIELINLGNQAMEKILSLTELLATGDKRFKTNSQLLDQATQDINLLLAFIKSKGLQPPKLQSKFIN